MITIKNLIKSVEDDGKEKIILKGINLEINEGERVVIIGPSGAGKSTLLRCINLLETFSSGEILFKDKSILDIPRTDLRRQIGMIFQHFNLFSHMSVKKNITYAPVKLKIYSKKEANKIAFELLKKVKLEDRIGFYPKKLSGGEKQRVAIARALAMNPEVLLIDEPTSALDPEISSEISNVLKSVAGNLTMISVTHDMNFAKNLATRIIFMENGEIIEDGAPDDMFPHSSNKRIQSFFSKVV